MNLDSFEIMNLKKGAQLHDIGKLSIDKTILNKPSKLTLKEFELVKIHTELGLKNLKNYHRNITIENIVLFHHEKWNGKGYPFGLAGKEIPIEARIVSIVDCYDALTCKRVYKEKIPHEKVMDILRSESGNSFEPDIIFIFDLFNEKFKKILIENE